MATVASVPEELIREILSYLLAVDEETFCDFPREGYPGFQSGEPRRDTQETRSRIALLLVSKQWLRIGTPLLYEKVLLRNTSRTKAVAEMVKANPTVGRAIKYLRLEGGMGKDLQTVIKHAPNIHTLWMSPHIRASESITGLKKVIALLQPRKAYFLINGDSPPSNKTAVEVERLIESCIQQSWASLKSIVFYDALGIERDLSHALREAPALRELTIDGQYDCDSWFQTDSFAIMAKNPHLQRVTIYGQGWRNAFMSAAARQGLSLREIAMFKFEQSELERILETWYGPKEAQ